MKKVYKRQFFVSLMLMLLIVVGAQAQQRLLTGTIADETGSKIPGVSVFVKGTNNGTSTDADGKFSIQVGENDVLVISFIGYKTSEVPVAGKTVLDFAMETDIQQLNEVVVVGYGTQEKKEITGAVASVSAESFNKGNVNDVGQLLQGKAPGLSITRAGGDPNNGFTIRLRGLSTLGANTQPLVVIDGQIGADLNSVDPNDIATIDILKDGSAAAIYGTRGSAGVILITTKKGSKGKATVDYSGYVSTESPFRFTKHMNANEFRSLGKGTDYGSNTDWNKAITRTAVTQVHNIAVAGGSGGTSYRASLNFRDPQGVAINTGFQQLISTISVSQKALNDKLTLDFTFRSTRRTSHLGWSEAFKYATIFNPTAPIYATGTNDLAGGGYFEQNFVDYANPVAVLKQNVNDQEIKRNNLTFSGSYDIIKGLRFTARYAQQTQNIYSNIYLPINGYFQTFGRSISGYSRHGYGSQADDESNNQLFESTFSYDTKAGDLDIAALAGYSFQDFLNRGVSARGGNFVTDANAIDLSQAQDFKSGTGVSSSYKNGSKLVAFFGRVNLNYKNFAFLSASIRREGSTQFGVNNKWGNFPAISGGVDFSKLMDIPSINNLKLRVGYGVTGALPPSSYLSFLLLKNSGSYFPVDGSYIPSYGISQNANPDLKWETKHEIDIGVDFAFLDNKLTGSIDYYDRNTKDLIYNAQVPVPPNLYNFTWLNVGTLKSNGVEVALKYNMVQKGDFSWNTGLNYTTYHVKLAALDTAGSKQVSIPPANLGTPGQEATQIARATAGQNIGILWGLVYQGVDETGKYKFKDLNGDGVIDAKDQTKVGNGLPKFEFGWTNSFTYKNWDLNFLIRGSIGHDLVNTYRAFYENPNVATSYNVVKTKYFNPNINDTQQFSSLFVERASFVKLDNATVGYNFVLPKEGSIRRLRVYVSGQNLFLITKYTGVDPEVRYQDGGGVNLSSAVLGNTVTAVNNLTPGIDRRETWVMTRTFTFGVNLGF